MINVERKIYRKVMDHYYFPMYHDLRQYVTGDLFLEVYQGGHAQVDEHAYFETIRIVRELLK